MRGLRIATGLALIASVLLACSGSVSGGLVGAVVTAIAGLTLLAVGGGSQTGCSSPPIQPCLSIVPEVPPPDAGPGPIVLQPCLIPDEWRRDTDADVLVDPDAGPEPDPKPRPAPPDPEPTMRVCLSEMTIDPPQGQAPATTPGVDKAAIKARLIAQGALPADVIDRLR